MKKSLFVPVALTMALGLTACADSGTDNNNGADNGSANAATYNWDMTVTTSDTSSWYLGAKKFAEEVEANSDGRITVNVFANDSLSAGDALAGIEQLMHGDKALSYNSAIQYSGIDDRFSAIAAPFTFANYDQVDQVTTDPALLGAYGDLSKEIGVKMLGFGENGFRQISNNEREIVTPKDVEGLKIRVAGSKLFLDLYHSLGADPLVMSFSELFTSLQNGTVDGQENAVDLLYANGLMEVQKHLSILNYVYDPLILGINEKLFNSLSAEDQKIVQDAANTANAFQIQTIRDLEKEQLVDIRKEMQVRELTADELAVFRDSLADLYTEWEDKWTPELYKLVQPK